MGFLGDIKETVERKKREHEEKELHRASEQAEREERKAEHYRQLNAQLEKTRAAKYQELKYHQNREFIQKQRNAIFDKKVAPIKNVLNTIGGGIADTTPHPKKNRVRLSTHGKYDIFNANMGIGLDPIPSKKKRRNDTFGIGF
jgi:hypothetical protein